MRLVRCFEHDCNGSERWATDVKVGELRK